MTWNIHGGIGRDGRFDLARIVGLIRTWEPDVHPHHQHHPKIETRLHQQSHADWKTAAAGRTQTKALPEPKVDMRDVAVRPNKSDSEITMRINQWAADTYPVAQKHLDTARTLENATKKTFD